MPGNEEGGKAGPIPQSEEYREQTELGGVVKNSTKAVIATTLIGLVLTVLVFAQQQQQQPKVVQTQTQNGRYQFFLYQGEMPRMNTFLLDSTTGKVWIMVSAPDQTTFWEPMPKVDNDAEEAVFIRRHPVPDKN
jgi:hypothetical protein